MACLYGLMRKLPRKNMNFVAICNVRLVLQHMTWAASKPIPEEQPVMRMVLRRLVPQGFRTRTVSRESPATRAAVFSTVILLLPEEPLRKAAA